MDNIRLSYAMPESCFEEPEGPDGPLIVREVPMMAEGEWTSAEGIKTRFTAAALKANAVRVYDNLVWLRHQLVPGENRPALESIGAFSNMRFDPAHKFPQPDGRIISAAAVICDVVLHRKTDESRGAASLIRLPHDQGGFRMVSSEIKLEEVKDSKDGWKELTKFQFAALTIQRKGACKLCQIPAFAAPGLGVENMAEEEKSQTPPSNPGGGEENVPEWAKALHAKVDKLLELEQAEAGKGQGEPKKEPEAPGAGMAAKGPTVEQFAAVEAEISTLKEENRKFKAALDKAAEQAPHTQTQGASFSEQEPVVNDKGNATGIQRNGGNIRFNRG
jgi:hypothetical protein